MLMYTQPFWHISADPCFLGGGTRNGATRRLSCGCCISRRVPVAAVSANFFVSQRRRCVPVYQPTCGCCIGRRVPVYQPTCGCCIGRRFFTTASTGFVYCAFGVPRSCREVCLSCAANLLLVGKHQGGSFRIIASCLTTCVSLLTASTREFLAKGVFLFLLFAY